MRILVIGMALAALCACSTPSPTEEFLTEMHQKDLVPTLGTDGEALDLARSICERLGEGDSWKSQFKNLRDHGFDPGQAQDMMESSTEHFCPT